MVRFKNVLSLFDGKYEVDSTGAVFSNARTKRVELVGKVTKHGYRLLLLTVNHKRLYKMVHRIVAEAFFPNPNNYPEVNHKDGNKLNNAVSNLEWCTSSQNQKHAVDAGLHKTKINMEVANQIRFASGSYSQIAKQFNVGKTLIGMIKRGELWVRD